MADDPASLGFSDRRLQRLDAHLAAYVDDGRLPGLAALVTRHGRVAYACRKGMADIDSRTPIRDDTLFRVFSMTKPVTSVAVMMLFEEGRLLLTDPVAEYLPELAALQVYAGGSSEAPRLEDCRQALTIADLLGHTSGLGYGHDDHPVDRMYREADLFRRDGTIAEMVQRLGKLPLKFQPGSCWEYGISHDVLGRLVEVVSGQSFDAFLDERIFSPLGMHDTAFELSDASASRLATLYRPAEDGRIEPERSPVADCWRAPVTFFAGGEGLLSTMADWWRFATMLLQDGKFGDERLLSPRSVRLMTSNRLTPEQMSAMWMPGYGYGLGFGVLTDLARHSSLGSVGEFTWAGSGSTFFWVDPQEQIVALLFTQFMPSAHYTIAREFKVLMYQALEC
jgi:CubicO group peptidase (beta-lactamase class C family)